MTYLIINITLLTNQILIPVNGESVSDGVAGCERAILAYKCMIDNASQVIYFLLVVRYRFNKRSNILG